jgi:Tfp pilus assembly protein PilX
MKGRTMGMSHSNSRGFTLIAALLLTVLLSGVAVGLLYMVSNEARMGGNDLEGNLAYYGAEAGIENLTSELSQLYQTSQTPNAAAITALTNPANYPTAVSGSNITNMSYVECITWPPNQTCPAPATNPVGTWDIVGSGPDQGMVATLIPFTLEVTASRQAGSGQVATYSTAAATGASVNLTRTVEVALLPAFEFGVFCDGDCDYFAGPNFNFGGRVHTNGHLFLASGSSLTFTDKIAAVGQVITDQLENGHATSSGYTGTAYVPNAGAGCPAAPGAGPAANCLAVPAGSWTGGFPPAGAANPAWTGISKSTFNGFIENGLTGAKKLQLPFVGASQVGAIDIIRRKQASDPALLSSSRLISKAEIRILLADTISDLHPDNGAGANPDGNDVQLVLPTAGGYKQLSYTGSVGTNYMYYATGTNGVNGWTTPTVAGCSSPWPLHGEVTAAAACQGVWLRVEYLNNAGNWVGVTQEWLQYGFGRPYNMPPTQPWSPGTGTPCPIYTVTPSLSGGVMSGGPYPAGQCYNPVSPAILILQQLQLGKTVANAYEGDTTNSSNTAGNWIPINFYDSREGEPRDNGTRSNNTTASATTPVYTPCGSSGVMNAVELDTGNLWLWLQRTGPYSAGTGNLVNNTNQGGYIVYFSDHRGMRADNHFPYNTYYNGMPGSSGLEDTVNSGSAAGAPTNTLESASYYTFSPEDVNGDTSLDTQGEALLGAGFNLGAPYISQPYFPIPANAVTASANQVNCNTNKSNVTTIYTGAGSPQNNMVTGPRHALRLVDGGMNGTTSYLPHAATTTSFGNGFTVASEEPVYVLGNYNSGTADPFWPSGGNPAGALHSASAIIADAVTLLSNPPSGTTSPTTNVGWQDAISFLSPGDVSNRPGNTSYYRVAIAAGKSIPFPQPAWGGQDFGTDGGMHNFLRYLENRGANGATVNYTGSLISMYYSQYATGVFKCCNVVYGAPQRNYFFDTQFLNPNNLPPGTPMFQDVVSLSYHQNFTPQ